MRASRLAFALACLAGVATADDTRPDDHAEHRVKRAKTRHRHPAKSGDARIVPRDDHDTGDDAGSDRDAAHDSTHRSRDARDDDHDARTSDARIATHRSPDDRARDGNDRTGADHPKAAPADAPPATDDRPEQAGTDARAEHPASHLDSPTDVAEQLAAQSQTIDRTLATVADKLAAADAARIARIRAAYRVLCTSAFPAADPVERMAAARRLAAARMLLARDADERRLLADEAARLHAAGERVVAASAKVPTLTFPADLAWPALGSIARHFGVFGHERSKTTLSRRGIDLDVDEHQPAHAPADGTVRYAGPIRGLGHGVIIDHGDFVTVVAKLGDQTIPAGTQVHRGDRIGRAARYRVYLEVRVRVGTGGLAIDPEPLLEKRKT